MKKFSIKNKPRGLCQFRKTAVTNIAFVTVPFVVETQEGDMVISPETVDDWDNGYFIAYPSDGSKPYSIAPSFVRANYEIVE